MRNTIKYLSRLMSTGLLLASSSAFAVTAESVAKHYADLAQAKYEDSLSLAKSLQNNIEALIAEPNQDTLEQARKAWIDSRVPYQQTEAYRFGNAAVDEWEGKVNAWPLDEGLIDYVDESMAGNDENAFSLANIIANETIEMSGQTIDASEITPELIQSLHELDGIEANVASGYHAIEFLLWGQDLNGVNAGAGERPATDFDPQNCTGGNCERRADYLQAATQLLIDDLKDAVAMWSEDGYAREAVLADAENGMNMAFTGLGSLSYGELAGERMKLGLILHDPEEEHDCFSDNTHYSHYYDVVGIENVWLGRYERIDGSVIKGPSLYDYVAKRDRDIADALSNDIQVSLERMQAIVDSAQNGETYDMLLAPGNDKGEQLLQSAIDALVAQTRNIERAVQVVGLNAVQIEGSDSLDNPGAVFQ